MHELIFILLNDDVLLFSFNLDDMPHILDVLDTFCQINGLTINVDQMKNDGNIIKATHLRHYPTYIQGRTNTSGVTL